MTHDELLAEINKDIDQSPWTKTYYPFRALIALRNVIKLHKPKSSEYFPVDVCVACSPNIDLWFAYPCPTIVAIDEVISNGR